MSRLIGILLGVAMVGVGVRASDTVAPATAPVAGHAGPTQTQDPFVDVYRSYDPGFRFSDKTGSDERKLSSEPNFFTLNLLPESSRANALVDAGKAKEAEGQFKEAIEIYQKVIDEYPDVLYRVNPYGVFVTINEYCQARILNFPKEHLQFYRTKFDSRAREAFELARQRNSLEGLALIRDTMLATSYGAQALKTLGFSALDKGYYLEALEYFERIWELFPDQRSESPDLALAMALCRKMLGMGETGGLTNGLIGHWKLDEGAGNQALDSSGRRNHGTFTDPKTWMPGKVGGALHFTQLPEYRSNCVDVPGSRRMDIGVGGADFSVAFWLNWESGAYPNTVFVKQGRSADEMLGLDVTRGRQVHYKIATQSPTWEEGQTRGAVAASNWTHVVFVKVGREVKLFLDGRLDAQVTLKAPVVKNLGNVRFGHSMQGAMDDVRLYNRALLNREAAELAGTAGAAAIAVMPGGGEAPLTVELSATGVETNAIECLWEFGDGQQARGTKVRHTYGLGGEHPIRLTVTDARGRVSVGQKALPVAWREKDRGLASRMSASLARAQHEAPLLHSQLASAPHVGTDDYLMMPPTGDPMGLKAPVWEVGLPASRHDVFVYSHPVVTANSVIYRHKNIIYCHSILNGELRWKNDMGGRVKWQDFNGRQFPQEDLLVQDGMVFTPLYKGGPTLVALDEITGRLKWAYGPMVASTAEESNLRFEAAPAGGPMTVYAGYIQDNIEGETHTDTEYGMMAFDSATGRIQWRRPVCSLRPGQFSAGFAQRRRNKIRSFLSPPLYAQGTVYYNSNAGAIAALDALSGKIKWVMRYPYYDSVHDATLQFGGLGMWEGNTTRHPRPQFWYTQRPLMADDDLYVLPLDSPQMFNLNRRTGMVQWRYSKPCDGSSYLLGVLPSGELALASSGRGPGGGVHLLDTRTGAVTWRSGDPVDPFPHPAMHYFFDFSSGNYMGMGANGWDYQLGARPFLSSDGHIHLPGIITPRQPGGFSSNLAVISLDERKTLARRRYLSGEILTRTAFDINQAAWRLKGLEEVPHKSEPVLAQMKAFKAIKEDTVPVNPEGPFMPFSRIVFSRHGSDFELRFGPRSVCMLYDVAKVKQALAGRTDPDALFAQAELAMGESRLKEAAGLMVKCLGMISSEDIDFRSMVNQLLFKAHEELVRANVRSGDRKAELANCIGMSRTVTTLADEVETLFAVAQAHARNGSPGNAARQLQSIARIYGQYEYPVPELLALDEASLTAGVDRILGAARAYAGNPLFGAGLQAGGDRVKGTFPVYRSAVSPLPKTLAIRAGERSALDLIALQKATPSFAQEFEKEAREMLAGKSLADQLDRLWEFPGTPTAQAVLEKLLTEADQALQDPATGLADQAQLRRRIWRLADTARICGLTIPAGMRFGVVAPPPAPARMALALPMVERRKNMEEERGTAWLALERRDDQTVQPQLMFLGGRVKKKLDNKFVLYCLDAGSGEVAWKAEEKRGDTWFDEIRLQGKGDEAGFFEAFVAGNAVVVHGLYDVLAFNLKDGKLLWRFETPFAFEIRHAVKDGDLLILSGQSETMALYLPTKDPRGEVVWQEKEEGDLYIAPYFHGDRLISVRKSPSSLTVRYRSTGKLMGRLSLPDLLQEDSHPLVDNGLRELPIAHKGNRLVVTDGWYYILIDVERLAIVWKRLIDANDPTQVPAMRFALGDGHLAVVKRDYDVKAIYMLSSQTGALLWRTDPKDARSPAPIYSMVIQDDRLYGLLPHAGQGFYFTGMDCKTGKTLFAPREQVGYGGKPEVQIRPEFHGGYAVAMIKDRQDFELRAFDLKDGKPMVTLKTKSAGDFGEHGRVSATVQNGKLVLFGKNELVMGVQNP